MTRPAKSLAALSAVSCLLIGGLAGAQPDSGRGRGQGQDRGQDRGESHERRGYGQDGWQGPRPGPAMPAPYGGAPRGFTYGERSGPAPYGVAPGQDRRSRGGEDSYAYPQPRFVPAAPPEAAIQGWRTRPVEPAAPRNGRMASLGWVIGRIQQRTPGRQLDAALDTMDGRPVYRVLWLSARGRRMDYYVDAETGVILGEK